MKFPRDVVSQMFFLRLLKPFGSKSQVTNAYPEGGIYSHRCICWWGVSAMTDPLIVCMVLNSRMCMKYETKQFINYRLINGHLPLQVKWGKSNVRTLNFDLSSCGVGLGHWTSIKFRASVLICHISQVKVNANLLI